MTFSGERLQQTERNTAASLDDVTHGRPFTPHLQVWNHWISVGAGRGVTKPLVEDLVRGSHKLSGGQKETKEL